MMKYRYIDINICQNLKEQMFKKINRIHLNQCSLLNINYYIKKDITPYISI